MRLAVFVARPPPPSAREDGHVGSLEPRSVASAAAPMHLAAAFKSMAHLPVRGVGDVTQQLVSLCLKSSPSERPSAHELLSGRFGWALTLVPGTQSAMGSRWATCSPRRAATSRSSRRWRSRGPSCAAVRPKAVEVKSSLKSYVWTD